MERIPIIQDELAAEVKARKKAEDLLLAEIADRKAEQRANKRRFRNGLVGYLILFATVVGVWHIGQNDNDAQRLALVQSGAALGVDGCNRDFVSQTAQRNLLERNFRLQERQYKSGTITKAQAEAGRRFYADALEGTPLPDCRKADDIVTSDPDEVPKAPVPRYPGDPQSKLGR